jgi:predicted Zn-ribbon and HTH transcriptional regulator
MEEKTAERETPIQTKIETKTFVCMSCGGTLKFDIDTQKFRCASCKSESEIEALSETVKEYDFSDYASRELLSVAFGGVAVAHCQNCGFEITFDEAQIATVCPMCASTQIATVKQQAGIPPEGIIPFQIDKAEAGQKFKKWVKSRWFAPGDFKKKSGEGALTGMYVPYWTYDANAIASYSGRGGKNHTVRDNEGHTKTVTNWYPVSGVVSESFDDILICASTHEAAMQGILPFNTVENTKPYAASYLSGFQAELYTIKADAAFETAKSQMEAKLRALAEREIRRRYDKAEVSSLSARFTDVTYKHVLLPVWTSVYGYRGKLFKYFINGETGKVSGQRPYSALKILAAIGVAVIVIGALIWLFSRN